MNKKQWIIGALLWLWLGSALAGFSPFKVQQIEIKGNPRIGEQAILSYLPIEPGQMVDRGKAAEALKALYATGFFKSAALFNENGKLIVKVVERPTIADVKIEGNSLINTEDLEKGLASIGIKKGQLFSVVKADQMVKDLRQQYENLGYYGAKIDIAVKPLPRNRVLLSLKIHEGAPATLGRITFTGNKAFEDRKLLSLMALKPGEQYAQDKLRGDLDKLQNFYLNKGFAQFNLRSTQVRLSPDKQKIYLTINLHEGVVYHFNKVKLAGELKLPRETLEKLIQVKPGQRFSRQAIVDSMNALLDKYSEHAYANAQVIPQPALQPVKRTVDLTFYVQPYNRVYVRKVVLEGNTRTRDHVIRRELRQLESAPYSQTLVKLSKKRLQKLGYFKSVTVSPVSVASDLVDLHVKVEEQPTGSFTAAVGYSQLDGVSFSLGVSERNILGSGNAANIKVSTSSSSKNLDLSLVNPYFTPNGVSLGVGAFWHEINADELSIANYTLNTLGGKIFSSIPLSEESQFSYGVQVKKDELVCGSTFVECVQFSNTFGKNIIAPSLTAGWSANTTNAYYFPTDGYRVNLSADITPTTSEGFGYGKLFASGRKFFPLTKAFTLKVKADMAYGTGFGDLNALPFYERFYVGGISSVRGFEPNSLGEHYDLTTDGTDVAKGGDFKISGTFALISPFPFIEDSSNIRVSMFVDYGYVYPDMSHFKADDLRVSTGVMLNWITPVGPLALSFAKPIRYDDNDKLQQFQFSLGISF